LTDSEKKIKRGAAQYHLPARPAPAEHGLCGLFFEELTRLKLLGFLQIHVQKLTFRHAQRRILHYLFVCDENRPGELDWVSVASDPPVLVHVLNFPSYSYF
jgi:hypothetical protein